MTTQERIANLDKVEENMRVEDLNETIKMDKVTKKVLKMDDETKMQFCFETFNHRFFEEFFQTICYEHEEIWREVVNKQLQESGLTKEDVEHFNNI